MRVYESLITLQLDVGMRPHLFRKLSLRFATSRMEAWQPLRQNWPSVCLGNIQSVTLALSLISV